MITYAPALRLMCMLFAFAYVCVFALLVRIDYAHVCVYTLNAFAIFCLRLCLSFILFSASVFSCCFLFLKNSFFFWLHLLLFFLPIPLSAAYLRSHSSLPLPIVCVFIFHSYPSPPARPLSLSAPSAPRHTVCHKMLEVEIKKEPVPRRLARRLP